MRGQIGNIVLYTVYIKVWPTLTSRWVATLVFFFWSLSPVCRRCRPRRCTSQRGSVRSTAGFFVGEKEDKSNYTVFPDVAICRQGGFFFLSNRSWVATVICNANTQKKKKLSFYLRRSSRFLTLRFANLAIILCQELCGDFPPPHPTPVPGTAPRSARTRRRSSPGWGCCSCR